MPTVIYTWIKLVLYMNGWKSAIESLQSFTLFADFSVHTYSSDMSVSIISTMHLYCGHCSTNIKILLNKIH